LVNKQGKEITPPVYDEIFGHQDPIVRLGDKYGFVSCKTGELLTPVKYDHAKQWLQIFDFSSRKLGKKDLAQVQSDGKWGCVNVRGEEIIPVKYERIEVSQSENPRVAAKLNGKWGFVSENGKKITDFEYDDVEEFCNGRARVKKNGKYGFINTKGAVVLPLTYDDCEKRFSKTWFKEERHILPIWVKCGSEHGNRYGFVDIDGFAIIPQKYENALPFTMVGNEHTLAAVVLNNAVGYINLKGENVIPFDYDAAFDNRYNYAFYGGFANVRQGGKWGVIDVQNRVVVNFLYDEFLENSNAGFRYALRDGKKWSVDMTGNEWEMQKNAAARTFKDYIHATEWDEVEKSFRTLIGLDEETIEKELQIYEINYLNFKGKQFKPSENIIRIHACYPDENCDWERPPVEAHFYSVKDNCSYGVFDWDEMLDMEIRIEDNLALTDADTVAVCLWEACDQSFFSTEESIKSFMNKLDEQKKTIDENKRDYGKPCEI
jgi:hypothetical protein